ncbi:MAG: isoprenylcysteine carboxylmethyltransferase family protein [Chitinophagaceae bacterium]|nr:isoprenylcysteine carboxylmethyltransferase family protein [Chitinophagaceae bacterium]
MTDLLRLILPAYFILFFGVTFVWKIIAVSRRTGKSPLVIPKDDSVYSLIGSYFKILVFALFMYVLVFAIFPACYDSFLPISGLDNFVAKYIGLGLLSFSLVWTIIAQDNMRSSLRIGIDKKTKTALITKGLFSVSRNPIYLGLLFALTGLILTTPNALTLLFLILGYVLIQIHIRLEEEFLTNEHGQKNIDYRQKVRRLI